MDLEKNGTKATRSSSREVRTRVLFFSVVHFSRGTPNPNQQRGEKGRYWGTQIQGRLFFITRFPRKANKSQSLRRPRKRTGTGAKDIRVSPTSSVSPELQRLLAAASLPGVEAHLVASGETPRIFFRFLGRTSRSRLERLEVGTRFFLMRVLPSFFGLF